MKNLKVKISDNLGISDKRYAIELDTDDITLLTNIMKKYNIKTRSGALKKMIRLIYDNEFND